MNRKLSELTFGDLFEDSKGDTYEVKDFSKGMVEVKNLDTGKRSCWPQDSIVKVF